MGEFGSGKTQNTTAYLKGRKHGKEINITNYYTGYTDYQLSSHNDLVNILNDIYDYHQYINLYDDAEKLHTHKPRKQYEEYLFNAKEFRNKYPNLKKDLKFNIVLDECSIYFNPRNFKKNFSGENERLLDFIYQPRKLNLLMFCVVQSPMELDVKFRRLATYYRKYYKGVGFYRWYRDFYFLDPEEIDLEKAEQVGGGILMGMNLNLYPIFPVYDYNTKELIRPGTDIYTKRSIYKYITKISQDAKPKKKLFNKLKLLSTGKTN
ncbi:hypothetical protein A9Q91_02955 [Candidatus Gracilibacteria bacterium 28_42_T64]|nr:hypothetical protein A9Q91_02955 [Candidatus Gracilibacteria bacterium 28_42_T64]